jgi:surfactin synthase thioesterase subunit/glycosyltransferase involved in cell wall biosynthesis
MARNGHECLVLCGGETDQEAVREGVRIRSIYQFQRKASRIGEAVVEFDPDFVLVSSEDLSHSLLREAHKAAKDRLVYLAHTPQWFPFGPEAWHRDEAATRLLDDALAIVSIGSHMAAYIEAQLGRKAEIIPPALYGDPPWPEYSNFDKQSVLLINPCTVKGLPIYVELAKRLPDKKFMALKGWGTTPADLNAMSGIEVLDTVASIDEVLGRTSVLVAPSLWYEGFGLVVTEALLRGIPVLASNHGGLTEAAASSRYRLPVVPITEWLPQHDETGMPVGVVHEQPVEAWQAALSEVLGDRAIYEQERLDGMVAARSFASGLSANDLENLLSRLEAKRLRIYLIHNSTYYPGAGGGDKSNRILVEELVQAGHQVRVFTRLEQFGEAEHAAHQAELKKRGFETEDWQGLGLSFKLSGAEVHVITRDTNLRRALAEDLADQKPDIILCSTDDPAHLLFETALQQEGARVVYLVRATIALPFGIDASSISEERTARLREADAIVCVSEYVARYCRNEGGLDAVHVPISLGDHANPPDVGRFDNPYVTLVNPSAVKGLPILLGLADAMPEIQFAAVPSWGTTQSDLKAIQARTNITVLDPVEDITEILEQTRVTLVPSLWAEARSRMVVESLSRAVPVMASDVGGLREAMCGVEHVLPVNPILQYQSKVSDQMVPEAEVPEQDLGIWIDTLRSLLQSEAEWTELSRRGRTRAVAYLESLSVRPLERIFRRSMAKTPQRTIGASTHLSPVKRKLLALRIARYREAQQRRFFPVVWGSGPKVFLFPWAEAGVQAWKFLGDPSDLSLLPALLPGREDRRSEPKARSFAELIPVMTDELERLLSGDEQFLLAGHSMGGGLAFEVARELRRRGKRMPAGLLVSSCTGPKARQQSAEIATEADRRMFQEHVYAEEAPLEIPFTAVCGLEEDLKVEAWASETVARFKLQKEAGGHFWLWTHPAEFLAALKGLLPGSL